MFTIKAFNHEGAQDIYSATQIWMNPERTKVSFTQGQNSDSISVVEVNPNASLGYSSCFIENMAGKTIESMRAILPD